MKKIVYLLSAALVLVACKSEDNSENADAPSLKDLLAAVQEMEDSLNEMSDADQRVPDIKKIELINRHLEVVHHHPKSDEAANSLDKVHMLYSGLGSYEKSAAYADTLLMRFPDYKDKLMLYESQGANYDIFIQPRDSMKVRYYYELLLEEDESMSAEKRKGLERRLQYNHLSFDEYLSKAVMEEAVK